jgi:glycosyltransferase involved in cell wall biosynthesis
MQTPDDRVNLVLAHCGDTAGRPERALWELATRLPASRFNVQAWLTAEPGLDEMAAALEAKGVQVERVPAVISRWDLPRRLAIRSRLRRARPAIVHLLIDRPCDKPTAPLADAPQASLVVSFHGTPEDGGTAEAASLVERASLVTAPHSAAAERIAATHGLHRDRIRIVPGGIDEPGDEGERAAAAALRETLDVGFMRPLWVSAARFEADRGQVTLLEAAAELERRGVRFVVAFAGQGPTRAALVDRAAALGVERSVRFVGPEIELDVLLRAADGFVSTAWSDGIPNALLEAMARERPVVATDVGGICDVVEDGLTGLVVPPGQVEALAGALHMLATHPEQARRVGEQGAHRVLATCTWPRVIESFELVYDEALGLATFEPEHAEAR